MQTKTKNVKLDKIHPEIRDRMELLDIVMKQYTGQEAVITSGHEGYMGDGVHGKLTGRSLHYIVDADMRPIREHGQAIDVRSRDVPEARRYETLKSLQVIYPSRLFDVVLEATHFHIEYDPEVKKK